MCDVQDMLAYEYETGDEFEAERLRDFAEWFQDLDSYKNELLDA